MSADEISNCSFEQGLPITHSVTNSYLLDMVVKENGLHAPECKVMPILPYILHQDEKEAEIPFSTPKCIQVGCG